MSNIRLGDVRYNAQAGAFGARVDVISGGAVMAAEHGYETRSRRS